jgi:hypothetical protein
MDVAPLANATAGTVVTGVSSAHSTTAAALA